MHEPRGLTREQAAAYVGLSMSGFDSARRRGVYPAATLPGKKHDRALLDKTMNELSGLAPAQQLSALEAWKVARGRRPS